MNLIVNIFVLICSIAQLSSAVEIKCEHKRNNWTNRGPIQECLVEYLKVSSPDEVVTKLNKHGYTSIKSFFIHRSVNCLYMPKGVEKFLDSLEVLVIAGTGLLQIKMNDLKPFEGLREMYMNDNKLEVIEGNLFKFNPDITIINFENNRIKQIECGALDPLIRLEAIKFKGNLFYEGNALSLSNVEQMKIELKEKTCLETSTEAMPQASALTQNCSDANGLPAVDCESSQSFVDMKRKIATLEVELNKTATTIATNQNCPQVVETTTKVVNCELTKPFLDSKVKIAKLEFELKKSVEALTATTKEFCERYNDHENEKCIGMETTTKMTHVDDQTEGFIEAVID
jgi:hypothetical protein